MSREGVNLKRHQPHLLITGELPPSTEVKSLVKLGRVLHKIAHVLNNIHIRSFFAGS